MTGPDGPPLLRPFLEHAARAPDAPALLVDGRSWTYAELEHTARRWAGAIVEAVGRRPARIAVFGARSEASCVGTLAAVLAGAAFVPLSPALPPARTGAMLAAAEVDALVADDDAAGQLSAIGPLPPAVLLPATERTPATAPTALIRRDVDGAGPLPEAPETDLGSMAYLLFTSGTTGVPKGVPISHANVGHFLGVVRQRYAFGPDDRFSQTFEPIFDLSVFDLFAAWTSGAAVCVPRPIDLVAPFRYVESHGITVWFSVPSLAMILRRGRLLKPGSLPTLRWSLFCGEALTADTAAAWQAAAPGSTVENLYGPTEATIACTAYRWDAERSPAESVDGLVPIGRPLPGVEALIVDDHLEPAEPGAAGELCIGGPQTFAGYWGDPRATERSFVGRFYRTGDRVRPLPGGDLAFLGRVDHQVQVMGHRVELGEIEAALRQAGDVVEAVVVPVAGPTGSAVAVVAFVTGSADADAVVAQVRRVLPAHAVPREVRIMEALPRTPSGKVDRPALERSVSEDHRLRAP